MKKKKKTQRINKFSSEAPIQSVTHYKLWRSMCNRRLSIVAYLKELKSLFLKMQVSKTKFFWLKWRRIYLRSEQFWPTNWRNTFNV